MNLKFLILGVGGNINEKIWRKAMDIEVRVKRTIKPIMHIPIRFSKIPRR
jgi:hypothetical protein